MIRFASGSNRPADIRGFAAIGRAIGVAFPEVSPESESALVALAGRGIPVFVDSGAFSEIEFGPAGPVVVAPITSTGWDARMAMYRRLGAALGSSCYVVAPDRIGDQAHTLALLTERAAELAEIAAMGAVVLVPIQKGSMTQAAFHRAVSAVLPFAWTPALPSKKNATTVDELEAYVAEIKPVSIHLLGLGEKNKNAARSLALIEQHSPGCVVSLDANLIAASVGRTNGRGGGPRILTAARDRAAIMLDSGEARGYTTQELGIILAFGTKEHEDDAYLSGWADLRV
jgi:hypothetical protein